MIPLRRCGSHAIRLRLSFSEEFYSPYPLHVIDVLNKLDVAGLDLNDDAIYKKLISAVIGLETNLLYRWSDREWITTEALFEKLRGRPRSIHAITGTLLLESARLHKAGAKIAMDKSLDCIHYAEELIAAFGSQVKFLFVTRDPRAQINSMNRAIIHEFSTLANALIWKDNYEKALSLKEKYPENVLQISFEEFLHKEKETLQKVCSFFGITFLDTMLEIEKSEEAKQLHTMSALWSSNYSAPILSNIDKFKKEMTSEDLMVVESVCGPLLDKLGYQRIYSKEELKEVTQEEIKASLAESAEKRKEQWKMLEYDDKEDYERRIKRAQYIESIVADIKGAATQ